MGRPVETINLAVIFADSDGPGNDGEDDWQQSAEQVQKNAALYRDTLDETLPVQSAKRKAKSAKSHIFRKDKVAAA